MRKIFIAGLYYYIYIFQLDTEAKDLELWVKYYLGTNVLILSTH